METSSTIIQDESVSNIKLFLKIKISNFCLIKTFKQRDRHAIPKGENICRENNASLYQ